MLEQGRPRKHRLYHLLVENYSEAAIQQHIRGAGLPVAVIPGGTRNGIREQLETKANQ